MEFHRFSAEHIVHIFVSSLITAKLGGTYKHILLLIVVQSICYHQQIRVQKNA